MTIGRRPKLTPKLEEEIIKLLRAGNYMRTVAKYVGITEQTLYNWIARGRAEYEKLQADSTATLNAEEKRYFDFFEKVQKAETHAEVRAVAYWQSQMEKDWRATKEFLARRYPEAWSPRYEISGPEGKPVNVQLNVDPEVLASKIDALIAEDEKRRSSESS